MASAPRLARSCFMGTLGRVGGSQTPLHVGRRQPSCPVQLDGEWRTGITYARFHASSSVEESEGKGFFEGLKDKFQSKADQKKNEKQNEGFQKLLVILKSNKRFTLQHMHDMTKEALDEGLSSWKSNVPGVKSSDEYKAVEKQLKIISAFTETERNNVDTIKRKQKLRVAADTGYSIEQINAVISEYDQVCMFHMWVRYQQRVGNKIPDTIEAAQKAFMSDRRGVKMPKRLMRRQRRRFSTFANGVDLPGEGSRAGTTVVGKRPTREALLLYRDVLRTSRAFYWADEKGRPWPEVLRESARKEFEEAREERDPLIVARLLLVGRDALRQVQNKHRDLEEQMKKHIATTRNG